MIGLILTPAQLHVFTLGDTTAVNVAGFLQRDEQAPLADLRAHRLGFVLQTGGLLPFLNVRQNIELPRRINGLATHSELVDDAIARLELSYLLDKTPAPAIHRRAPTRGIRARHCPSAGSAAGG